ncbi:MAG TPA: hypothetical protein VN577_10250 [Terriglobales bacterium]|nr:hypothetical protein [Terriglobales bacterium]
MADRQPDAYPLIRKLLPYTTALLVIVTIYVGYIVYSRWKDRRDAAEQVSTEEVQGAQKSYEAYGKGQVKVLNFTADPGVVHPGQKVSICYGVSNAKTVAIEPKPEGETWPSLARCVSASPTKSTAYTITAKDESGNADTKTIQVNVD